MWISAALLAFGLAVGAHAVAARIATRSNRVVLFLLIGGMTGLGLWLILGVRYQPLAAQTLAGVLAYAFLCETYLFLFTLALSSISASLLLTLRSGEMSQAEIEHKYDSQQMVLERFQRLTSTGLIRPAGQALQAEEFEITERGARLLSALNILRRWFKHDA